MTRFDRHDFLPDTSTSIAAETYHFTRAAQRGVQERLQRPTSELYRYLVTDIESEDSQLLALALVHGTFQRCSGAALPEHGTPGQVAQWLLARRQALSGDMARLHDLRCLGDGLVLKCRAPIALVAGCWLDRVSQPATEPAVLVSQLTAHRFALRGNGVVGAGQQACRSRAMAALGVHVPDLSSSAFVEACGSPVAVLQDGAFYLALSRWSASYLPEVVGLHYAHYGLALDDRLLGCETCLPQDRLDGLVTCFYEMAAQNPGGAQDLQRFLAGVRAGVLLEERCLAALLRHAQGEQAQSLTRRVGAIIKRHMPYAGRQHAYVRMGDRRLPDWFEAYTDEEIHAFLAVFSQSRSVKRNASGGCPFLEATKFGGSMFGLFSARESAVLAAWVRDVQEGGLAGQAPGGGEEPGAAGDEAWPAEAFSLPENIRWEEPGNPDDRVLFHRLVNIERYANMLEPIRLRIERNLRDAECLFEHGRAGRFTDASWLPWDKERLEQRAEAIYWSKLVDPWQRLTAVADRDTVIFGQKLAALGSLVDGCWAHRVAGVGRYRSRADAMLYAIYADEMGNGEIAKNHIVLIQRVLRSMDVVLPHIRDEAFIEQSELPDLYDFPLHQLGLSLFPDSFYPEILGYNLGIEMLGLGEMRLHEIQKLRRHGFDTIYEEAHLTIDNFSSGHARQSLELIESFMDDTARSASQDEVACVWRRIWRGYASFAWFIETDLKKAIGRPSTHETAELTL